MICVYSIYLSLIGIAEVWVETAAFKKLLGKNRGTLAMLLPMGVGIFMPYLQVSPLLKVPCFGAALLFYGLFILKAGLGKSFLYALLTVEVMQLCYGIFHAAFSLIFPFLYPFAPAPLGWIFMVAGDFFGLGAFYFCYHLAFQRWGNAAAVKIGFSQSLPVLFPLLLIFAVSEFISQVIYGNTVSLEPICFSWLIRHLGSLLVQGMSLICIFYVLSAYWALYRADLPAQLAMVEQQNRMQKQYIAEARARYESTKAFRHDVKNHLLVLRGLLEKQRFERAYAYLSEMEIFASKGMFPFQTNSPVLDILLENKASLAAEKGIEISCSLKVPAFCQVSDADLCTILSNALDNAIQAYGQWEPGRSFKIFLSGRCQGTLLLLEIKNPFSGRRSFQAGIGLKNIRETAKKYGGTMTVKQEEGWFSLQVLLDISRKPSNISRQYNGISEMQVIK